MALNVQPDTQVTDQLMLVRTARDLSPFELAFNAQRLANEVGRTMYVLALPNGALCFHHHIGQGERAVFTMRPQQPN